MPFNIDQYTVNEPEIIDSPALLIFPAIVRQNIQTAISMVGDTGRLRPHVKTCKAPCAVQLMQEAGIQQFKCATISEAEMLGMLWAKDVLLAYQPAGPKLRRFIELINNYPKTDFSCLTDNLVSAGELIAALEAADVQAGVFIDVNIGMNRSGADPEMVLAIMKQLSGSSVIKRIGLHLYDGHITNPDCTTREIEARICYDVLGRLLNEIEDAGGKMDTVVMGGSPAFFSHCKMENIQCSPGTFIYWDKTYLDNCSEQHFQPAALLMTRVVSLPAENLITVDLGHKAIAAENPIERRVYFMNDLSLVPVSHSEEHFVLRNDGDKMYKVGDVLYGIPYHVCPTVALYEKAVTIDKGDISGEWATVARDRSIMI